MRMTAHSQLWFAPMPNNSQQLREYEEMSALLDEHPQLLDLVLADISGEAARNKGRNGMSAEQVLRALVVKQQNNISYDKLEFLLNDSLTYRWFCRLQPNQRVSRATLNDNIKAISPETMEALNRMIVKSACNEGLETIRKVRTDCTVVGSNIHKPTDSSLLADSVRVVTRLLTKARAHCSQVLFKNHTRVAKRRALRILDAKNAEKRYKPYCDLIDITTKTVDYAERAIVALNDGDDPIATTLRAELTHYSKLAKQVIDQTRRRIIDNESVPCADKVVSVFEPHTDIIVKDRRETLYGHKICISVGSAGVVLDCQILDGNPADSTLAVETIERVIQQHGRAPRQVAFDGAFTSIDNLQAIQELGVEDVCFSKSRGLAIEDMVKSKWVYKQLRNFRAGIEGVISFLKRSFGLSICTWKGLSSFKSYVWSSIFSANLLTLARQRIKRC